MDEIGEAVGMSGPSLYQHVTGKADILLDAYDRAGAFVVAGAAAAVARPRQRPTPSIASCARSSMSRSSTSTCSS